MRKVLLAVILLAAARAVPAQIGEINALTDLFSPFPPGCIALELPDEPVDVENTLVDTTVPAPSINSNSLNAQIHITIWRVGCLDDDYSVVMVRLRQVNTNNEVVMPQVFAQAGNVNLPLHEAQLISLPAVGNVGASGGIVSRAGQTFMLGVDPIAISGSSIFLPEDYNDQFTVEFFWGAYSPAGNQGELFVLPGYEPSLDPPQFDEPVLHGRYNGQWNVIGVERTGLGLHIAEQTDDTNFVFVMFYTYLDGEPFWVTGNTGASAMEPGPVSMDMYRLEGGEFFTLPDQPPSSAFVQQRIGELSIRPLDCNRLQIDYDFSQGGFGAGTLELVRFIRTAGYDCNPWE